MQVSHVFSFNYYASAHVVINQGGTSSGKTYSILQVLFCLACIHPKQIITVVGQDIPNLKAGALRDALSIHTANNAFFTAVKGYNKTDRIFEFYNESIIEFKSYDSAQDAKSGKRDYLFVNEANGLRWEIYTELALRTKQRISTISIVVSVMGSYFNLKNDITEMKSQKEMTDRVNDIRLKVLENHISLLQTQVDEIKKAGIYSKPPFLISK